MCGRFVVYGLMDDISKVFSARSLISTYKPNYNISPGQNIPVIIKSDDGNIVESMRWGLIPSWDKEDRQGYKMINARAEGIEEKPSHKEPFQTKRCIIVANGFFEWKEKQPIYISLKDRKIFGMAGIYDEHKHGEKIVRSCSIITTVPNEFMQKIHQRMPVIIPKNEEQKYLEELNKARKMLMPSSEQFQSWHVTPQMNSPRFNTKECIKPITTLGGF